MVSTLEKLGVLSVFVIGVNFTRILSEYLYKKSLEKYYKKNKLRDLGQWGVVLGADKSIGQAYAIELAKQGLNVVLIGDNLAKLSTLSSLLEKYFQVFTGVIALTFTANEFKYLEKALCNLDIAVLINTPNYGEGFTQPEYFLKIPQLDRVLSFLVYRNLTIVTKMCAIVLPGMVSKKKGIIVNLSSFASKTSCPLLALYGASAAYVEKLSEELRNEYSSSGVIVQTLLPGYVLGNSHETKSKSWLVPSSKEYVSSAVKRLWYQGETSGYTPHSIIHGIWLNIQALCPKTTAGFVRRTMESVRDNSLSRFFRAENVTARGQYAVLWYFIQFYTFPLVININKYLKLYLNSFLSLKNELWTHNEWFSEELKVRFEEINKGSMVNWRLRTEMSLLDHKPLISGSGL